MFHPVLDAMLFIFQDIIESIESERHFSSSISQTSLHFVFRTMLCASANMQYVVNFLFSNALISSFLCINHLSYSHQCDDQELKTNQFLQSLQMYW